MGQVKTIVSLPLCVSVSANTGIVPPNIIIPAIRKAIVFFLIIVCISLRFIYLYFTFFYSFFNKTDGSGNGSDVSGLFQITTLFTHDVHLYYHSIHRISLQKQVARCLHKDVKYLRKNSF